MPVMLTVSFLISEPPSPHGNVTVSTFETLGIREDTSELQLPSTHNQGGKRRAN